MQIPINLAKPGELPEWCLIELQGSIESSDMERKFVGHLFFTKQGEPILVIGHHELRGKEVKLNKPILIMRKKRTEQSFDGESEATKVHYEVQAVARRKLLFKGRPKPIVSKTRTAPK